MAVLVVAEHDNAELKEATFNTVTAATEIGGDVHILVAGTGCRSVADAAAGVAGVSKILFADDAAYEHHLAEIMAPLLVSLTGNYDAILAPADTFGKDFMPRAAALLDVAQISDIQEVVSSDTFVRPVYAGNALATVRSEDATKFHHRPHHGLRRRRSLGRTCSGRGDCGGGEPGHLDLCRQ